MVTLQKMLIVVFLFIFFHITVVNLFVIELHAIFNMEQLFIHAHSLIITLDAYQSDTEFDLYIIPDLEKLISKFVSQEVTEKNFEAKDFRASLENGVLLCE